MQICFINPPFLKNFSRSQRSPAVTKGGTIYYPYFLAYAAGWAQKNGFEVSLFDFIAEGLDFSASVKRVRQFAPDLIVIETSTPSIFNDIKFAQKIKKQLPDTFCLLVGTHPSALPEWTLNQAKEVDAVAVGEYDQTVVEVAETMESQNAKRKAQSARLRNEISDRSYQQIDGLVFRSGNKIIRNKPRAFIRDLDQLPFVSSMYKQFLDPKKYYFAAADFPMVMIIGGRGCPFGCSFCLYPQVMHGLGYRARSPQNLADEFEYIRQNLPEVKEIVLEDDTFTADPVRVRQFCRLLIRQKNKLNDNFSRSRLHLRGGRLKWSANVRVGLDLQTMKLMKASGCRLVIVGYESGSDLMLKSMGKKIHPNDSLKFAQNAKKAGLLVHGCFVVGNPGETLKTMRQTLDFAIKLDPDSAQFYPLFVYPGTKAYTWAKDNHYLKTEDYALWLKPDGSHNCVVDLPNLSAQQMMDFCDSAYKKFHLRPRYIVKKIAQLFTDPSEGVRSLRSGMKYLAQSVIRKS